MLCQDVVRPIVYENLSECGKRSGIGLGGSRHVMFVGQVDSDRGGVEPKCREVEKWESEEMLETTDER